MATTTQVKADLAAPSGPSWTDWVSFYFNNLYYSGLPMLFWIRPQWNVDQLGSQKGRVSVDYQLRRL
jgi:hypothetical protein